jgi:hypothetical protein
LQLATGRKITGFLLVIPSSGEALLSFVLFTDIRRSLLKPGFKRQG